MTLLMYAKLIGMLILFVVLMLVNDRMTKPPIRYVLALVIGSSCGWIMGWMIAG